MLLPVPLLPGCPRAAGLSRGRSWAHSGAVRACPDPLFGEPYMQHRIFQADRLHELHSQGREDLCQRSRGHELFATTCLPGRSGQGTGTFLRAPC
ncbi:MAG: hypothetical protein ACP5OU_02905 [Methanothrix sp.]